MTCASLAVCIFCLSPGLSLFSQKALVLFPPFGNQSGHRLLLATGLFLSGGLCGRHHDGILLRAYVHAHTHTHVCEIHTEAPVRPEAACRFLGCHAQHPSRRWQQAPASASVSGTAPSVRLRATPPAFAPAAGLTQGLLPPASAQRPGASRSARRTFMALGRLLSLQFIWIFRDCFFDFNFVCNYVKCLRAFTAQPAQGGGPGLCWPLRPHRPQAGSLGGGRRRRGQKPPSSRNQHAPRLSLCFPTGCQAGGKDHLDVRAALPQGEGPPVAHLSKGASAPPLGRPPWGLLTAGLLGVGADGRATLGGLGGGPWPGRGWAWRGSESSARSSVAVLPRSSGPRSGLGAASGWTAPSRPVSRRRLCSGISTCESPTQTSSAAARWVPRAPGLPRAGVSAPGLSGSRCCDRRPSASLAARHKRSCALGPVPLRHSRCPVGPSPPTPTGAKTRPFLPCPALASPQWWEGPISQSRVQSHGWPPGPS